MKKWTIFLFSVILAMQLSAQQSDEAAVTAATETLRKGMMEKNKAILEQITSSALTYGHSSGLVENKTQYVEAVLTGPVTFAAIDISSQTVSVQGDVAIVRHTWNAKLIENGNPRDLKLGVMLVWKKEKKEWKLLGRQAFKL